MNWQGVLGISLASAVAGAALCFAGMRGCEDGSVNKLLEANARLKVEAQQHEAKAQRHEAALKEAQAQIDALEAQEPTVVEVLKVKWKKAKLPPDERDQLIEALDADNKRLRKLDLFNKAALQEAISRGDQYRLASQKNAERADMLEGKVSRGRRDKILIGVGSALGGLGLTLGAVAAAGKLQ